MDGGDGNLRLKGDSHPAEGGLGSSKLSARPHARALAGPSPTEALPKQEERPCEGSDSELGASACSALAAVEKNRKAAALGSNSKGCRTEGAQSGGLESSPEPGELQGMGSEGASAGAQEAGVCQKHVLHLLPGMSSDSDIECDTENEEQEEATSPSEMFNQAFTVQPSSEEHSSVLPDGGQDTSEDLSFVPGDDSTR